jgi:hypothetical protein
MLNGGVLIQICIFAGVIVAGAGLIASLATALRESTAASHGYLKISPGGDEHCTGAVPFSQEPPAGLVFQLLPSSSADVRTRDTFIQAREAIRRAGVGALARAYRTASDSYSGILSRAPGEREALVNRGLCRLKLGDPAGAMVDLRAAAGTFRNASFLRPEAVSAAIPLHLLGYALLESGRLEEAVSHFEQGFHADSLTEVPSRRGPFGCSIPFPLAWLAVVYCKAAVRRSAARVVKNLAGLQVSVQELRHAGEAELEDLKASIRARIELSAAQNLAQRMELAERLGRLSSLSRWRAFVAWSLVALALRWIGNAVYHPPDLIVPPATFSAEAKRGIYSSNDATYSRLQNAIGLLAARKDLFYSLSTQHAYRLRSPKHLTAWVDDWFLGKADTETLVLVEASSHLRWSCHILAFRRQDAILDVAIDPDNSDTSPYGVYVELPGGPSDSTGAVTALDARVKQLVGAQQTWEDVLTGADALFVPMVDRPAARELLEDWRRSNSVIRYLLSRIESRQTSEAPLRHNSVSLAARVFSIDGAGPVARYSMADKIVERNSTYPMEAGTVAHELTHALLHEMPDLERAVLLSGLEDSIGFRHRKLRDQTIPLFYDIHGGSEGAQLRIMEECVAFLVGSLAARRSEATFQILRTPYPTSVDDISVLYEPLFTADVEDLVRGEIVPACMSPTGVNYSDPEIGSAFYDVVAGPCSSTQ